MNFSGIGNVSSLSTCSWTRGSMWWRKMEVTLDRPEIVQGFSTILLNIWLSTSQRFPDAWRFWNSCWVCFCRLKTFRFALKFSTEIFAPYGLFSPLSGFPEFVVSSWQFFCTICDWEYEVFSLVWSILLVRWFFEGKFLMRSSTLRCPQSGCLLSTSSPRSTNTRDTNLVILSSQIDEVLIDDVLISDATQPLPRMVLLMSWMVLRIVSHWESSHLPIGRGRFADSNSIPLNQPTIVDPILIVTIQLKSTFIYSSYCCLRIAICLGSMRSGRWVIPW